MNDRGANEKYAQLHNQYAIGSGPLSTLEQVLELELQRAKDQLLTMTDSAFISRIQGEGLAYNRLLSLLRRGPDRI